MSEIVSNWKEIEIIKDLQDVKEINPWHLEDNVFVHTELVVDQFNKYQQEFSLSERKKFLGFLACIFHDVGKAVTIETLTRDDGSVFTRCSQHERISARMFVDWYLSKGYKEFDLTPDEVYIVALMIQSHFLKQLSEQRTKSVLYTLNYYNHLDTFKCVLLADINGRIVSSEYSNKIKEISNSIRELSVDS